MSKNNLRSITDQNIKLSMTECVRWIFSTSGDEQDQYGKYLKGWQQWIDFGIRNAYYSLLTGWVHGQFKPDAFIEVKRFDELLKQSVLAELDKVDKENG